MKKLFLIFNFFCLSFLFGPLVMAVCYQAPDKVACLGQSMPGAECRWEDDAPIGCWAVTYGQCDGASECETRNNTESDYCCCDINDGSNTYSCQTKNDCGSNCHTEVATPPDISNSPIAQTLATEPKETEPLFFTPNVDIPGFFEGEQKITPESIGLYINAVYKYGAGLAGVMAMFMIVFAAWQWIIAAGNSGKIENAKETIISALVGLALLFGGNLLLNQISSRLVNLDSLKIKAIETSYSSGASCNVLNNQQCSQRYDCQWSSNHCIDKPAVCPIDRWTDVSLLYAQNNNKLICCSHSSFDALDYGAAQWQIFRVGMKDRVNDTCGEICPNIHTALGNPFSVEQDLDNCLEWECDQHDVGPGAEAACRALSFCEWNSGGVIGTQCHYKGD